MAIFGYDSCFVGLGIKFPRRDTRIRPLAANTWTPVPHSWTLPRDSTRDIQDLAQGGLVASVLTTHTSYEQKNNFVHSLLNGTLTYLFIQVYALLHLNRQESNQAHETEKCEQSYVNSSNVVQERYIYIYQLYYFDVKLVNFRIKHFHIFLTVSHSNELT